MKKMNKKQKIIISLMIVFMILTDILICFDNSTVQIIGYMCLFVVGGLGIYYVVISRHENKLKQEQEVKKIIDEFVSKKES